MGTIRDRMKQDLALAGYAPGTGPLPRAAALIR
jgi:hypothetical protein